MFAFLLKFAFTFVVLTIVSTIAWELFVDNRLYHCVDGGFLDYLSPGDWVHDHAGEPVRVVPEVLVGGDMSQPDTIKEGWTVKSLWILWNCFFEVSLIVSAVLARLRWVPLRWREL